MSTADITHMQSGRLPHFQSAVYSGWRQESVLYTDDIATLFLCDLPMKPVLLQQFCPPRFTTFSCQTRERGRALRLFARAARWRASV